MDYLLENVEGNKVEWILEVELSSGINGVSVFYLNVKTLKNFIVYYWAHLLGQLEKQQQQQWGQHW